VRFLPTFALSCGRVVLLRGKWFVAVGWESHGREDMNIAVLAKSGRDDLKPPIQRS
jgi:hypothetical protein